MGDTKEKSCREYFGERLKLLRTEKGLSQEALSKDLGISKGSLGFYETCKNTPDIVVLKAVSDYFKVSFDYLLGVSDNRTTDIDMKAVCNYTGLSEKAVESLLMSKKIESIFDNKWLYSTIEFVLEDIFEDVKERYGGGVRGNSGIR